MIGLSIIIPAYNESKTIEEIINRVLTVKWPSEIELIVINDASTDNTSELLAKLDKKHQKVRVYENSENLGKTQTVKRGISLSRGEYVAVQDADLEYNPIELHQIYELALTSDVDVVYGNRFGVKNKIIYLQNYIGNRLLSVFSNFFTYPRIKVWIPDMEVGYKLIRGDVARSIGSSIQSKSNFGLEPEITAKLSRYKLNGQHLKFKVLPISYEARSIKEGKKMKALSDGFKALKEILKFNLKSDKAQPRVVDYKVADAEGMSTLEAVSSAEGFNKWMYEQISKHCSGRVLEIGSGIGNISKYFVEDGYDIHLSDLNPQYIERLKVDFPKCTIHELDILDNEQKIDMLPKFDSIYALNVFEHLDDHERAIKNVERLLKPGGTFIMLVPAYPFLYNKIDADLGHFRRYKRKVAQELFESANLEIIDMRSFNVLGTIGWFVRGTIFKKNLISKESMSAYERMLPIAKFLDFITLGKIGMSLITVGKKATHDSNTN